MKTFLLLISLLLLSACSKKFSFQDKESKYQQFLSQKNSETLQKEIKSYYEK